MWIGTFANAAGIAVGGLLDATLGKYLPKHILGAMPMDFGILCLGIRITLTNHAQSLAVLAIAFFFGTFFGKLMQLENRLESGIERIRAKFNKKNDPAASDFLQQFVSVIVLSCASGMGIFGSIREGPANDSSIFQPKAILDFFSATIFATHLGFSVATIAIPMALIQCALAGLALLVMPYVNPPMLENLTAIGGLIMLATGLRICGIKPFAVVNMLPGLLLVMPCTALWAPLPLQSTLGAI